MKKMIFLKFITITLVSTYDIQLQSGFSGFEAQQESNTYNDQRLSYYSPTTTATTPTNCPITNTCSNSTNTTTYYIPTFVIQLGDENGTTLNGTGHVFNTPTPTSSSYPNGFNLQNSVFSVHIFPKSNSITATGVTSGKSGQDGTYIVAYTLKDPAGSIIYKEFDQGLSLKNLPHQITLVLNPTAPATTPATAPNTTGTTTPQAATWSTTNSTMIAQSIFIPNMKTLTTSTRQQIINGISPIAQKFLFTQQSDGTISAIAISGTFDADSSSPTPSYSLVTNPFSGATQTSGKPIGQFAVSFGRGNSTPLIIFTNPTEIAINETDLTQGLILNVCIFPSDSGNNYPVIATLRTMDGLKLQKTAVINYINPLQPGAPQPSNYLSTLPTTISIQYASSGTNATSATPILLTTSFLNEAAINQNSTAANQAFTINGALNLRFVIFRPKGGNFMVTMV